jgi:ATP phosphoribosyltransferase
MLNIALPKGRLGDKVYALFSSVGYDCAAIYEDNRKLVFENPEKNVRYLLVKPSDVAIYVEHGAADIGVVGRDVLLETQPDVYQLLDLELGKCSLAVAAKNGWQEDLDLPLRVATKYPHVAKSYYDSRSRAIEIIKLNGSIELAPILGLSDVIVDIVETGTTLKENNLSVVAQVAPSSAWLIANKAGYPFHRETIDGLCAKLRQTLQQKGGQEK